MRTDRKEQLRTLLKDELSKLKLHAKNSLHDSFPWKAWRSPFDKLGWALFFISLPATLISLYTVNATPFLVFTTLLLIFYWKLSFCMLHTFLYALSRPLYPVLYVSGRYLWIALMVFSLYIPLKQAYTYLREGHWYPNSVIDGLEPLIGSDIRVPPNDWVGLYDIIFNAADSLNFGVFLFGIAIFWAHLIHDN